MKRVAESRRDDLRKRGTLRAARIDGAVRLNSKLGAADAGDMTEFVNHGTLLCRHQQQQEAERFQHASHSIDARNNPICTAGR
jgi:fructose-1-phosphate kinase PfkB-like protein